MILAEHTGKKVEEIERDTDRDFFMSAKDACDYGLVDEVNPQGNGALNPVHEYGAPWTTGMLTVSQTQNLDVDDEIFIAYNGSADVVSKLFKCFTWHLCLSMKFTVDD